MVELNGYGLAETGFLFARMAQDRVARASRRRRFGKSRLSPWLFARQLIRCELVDCLPESCRGNIFLRQITSRSEFFDAFSDNCLFADLRDHDNRHTIVKTFAHTVHSAMRYKNAGTLEDFELRHMWTDGEIAAARRRAPSRGYWNRST